MAIGQQDFQYDKFKTPFYKLEVGDASGTNMVVLPPSLHRLVEKIEIVETLAECFHSTQITITLAEGSREPFKQNPAVSSKALYGDADTTNTPGMLTDLEFTKIGGSTGFTSVSPANVGAVLGLLSDASSATGVLGAGGGAPEQQLGTAESSPKKSAKYVFEEKNMIKITWGYREDLQNTRTVAGRIGIVQSQFPESGHPKLVITCLPSSAYLDQITPAKGVTFYTQSIVGVDTATAAPIISFDDKPTKDVLQEICDKAGMKCIVSDNILSPKTDKYHAKTIPAGKSFHQFIKGLAKNSNAYYVNFIDPKTNKDYIAFISRNDWESKPIIPNEALLRYKGAGSILKSLNIRADFSGVMGNGVYGVDSTGQTNKANSNTGSDAMVLFEGGQQVDANPTSGNAIPAAEGLNNDVAGANGYIIGKVINSPEADDPQSLLETSKSVAHCQGKLILIDFNTVGFPLLRPGVVKFSGIGRRYTGQYNITTVTHSLDPNNYSCRGTAMGNAIYGLSGIAVPAAQVGESNSQVPVQLFQGASLNVISNPSDIGAGSDPIALAGGNAMEEYNNVILGTA